MSTVLKNRIILMLCVAWLGSASFAATVFWTGGGDPNTPYWGIAENWDVGVPTSGDQARITADGAAVVIPSGESYEISGGRIGEGATSNLYIAPEASLTSSGNVSIGHNGASTYGTVEVDGTFISGNRILFSPGNGANGTLIVNEGGYAECGLMLMGEWGTGGSATLIMNGGTAKNSQLGAYMSRCDLTLDLNDGLFDTGFLNPAVMGLYDSPDGSLYVDINYATWIINDNRTADVQTMIDRGELVGFGGYGTVEFDYDLSNPNHTTVTATDPANPYPAHREVVTTETVSLEWDNYVDPNAPGGTVTATVWFGTDPKALNKIVDAQEVTPGQRSSSDPQPIVVDTTYYWQVIFDNGSDSPIEGPVYQFLAFDNAVPQVSVKNVITWLDTPGNEAVVLMDATVVDDTTGYNIEWTLEPVDDPNVVIDSTSIEDPTLTINSTGTRTLTLTVDDGDWTVSDSAEVRVYANPCAAARQSPGYEGDPVADIAGGGNCVVDLGDFAVLALSWLEDFGLSEYLYY